MDSLYNTFFSHSESLQGIMLDTVIFFGMVDAVISFIKIIISFGSGKRL